MEDDGFRLAEIEFDSNILHYVQTDGPVDDITKGLEAGRPAECVLLVVSAADRVMPQTREHAKIAAQLHPAVVVHLNKADLVDDAEELERVENEVRELASEHFDHFGDSALVIGSARMALEGKDDNGMGTSSIKKFVETLDPHVHAAVTS